MSSCATPHYRGLAYLRAMLGPQAEFRAGQWEAIEAVSVQRRRVLLVQRTGWGKSLVYFLATRLLRDEGAGPTLLISPLLSLIRTVPRVVFYAGEKTLLGQPVIADDVAGDVLLGRNALDRLILLLDEPAQQAEVLEKRPQRR